jgi:hypothetical protein
MNIRGEPGGLKVVSLRLHLLWHVIEVEEKICGIVILTATNKTYSYSM